MKYLGCERFRDTVRSVKNRTNVAKRVWERFVNTVSYLDIR